jgi:hypothetical protein
VSENIHPSSRTDIGHWERPEDVGDPFLIARLAGPDSQLLVAWLEEARADLSQRGKPTVQQSVSLDSILNGTELPSVVLFRFAHAFHLRFSDPSTTISIYNAAAHRADIELKRDGHSPAAIAVLLAMCSNSADFKAVLWPRIESNDPTARDILKSIYTNMTNWVPANNKTLAHAYYHCRIGVAECILWERNPQQALQILNSLDPATMADGEQATYHWAMSLALTELGRDAEAVDHVKKVIDSPKADFPELAYMELISSLLRLNRLDEALKLQQICVAKYGIDPVTRTIDHLVSAAKLSAELGVQ